MSLTSGAGITYCITLSSEDCVTVREDSETLSVYYGLCNLSTNSPCLISCPTSMTMSFFSSALRSAVKLLANSLIFCTTSFFCYCINSSYFTDCSSFSTRSSSFRVSVFSSRCATTELIRVVFLYMQLCLCHTMLSFLGFLTTL